MKREFPVSQKLVTKLTDWRQRVTESEDNDSPAGLEHIFLTDPSSTLPPSPEYERRALGRKREGFQNQHGERASEGSEENSPPKAKHACVCVRAVLKRMTPKIRRPLQEGRRAFCPSLSTLLGPQTSWLSPHIAEQEKETWDEMAEQREGPQQSNSHSTGHPASMQERPSGQEKRATFKSFCGYSLQESSPSGRPRNRLRQS